MSSLQVWGRVAGRIGAAVIALAMASSPCKAAGAAEFATMHIFDGLLDARNPVDGVVDLGGVLYGVSSSGGDWGWGTIFSFNPTTQVATPLYNFSQGKDGGGPAGGLVAVHGVLFGTTSTGADGYGTIFRFDPVTGKLTTLYRFGGGADGGQPAARMIEAGGLLYGTTAQAYNGASPTGSTIFSFDPVTGTKTVLYSFQNNGDGVLPQGALLAAADELYGTTSQGTVFALHLPDLKFTTLVDFGVGAGQGPMGSLLLIDGALYGTTHGGGIRGCGSVFRTNASTGATSVLYEFKCKADGGNPDAGLVWLGGKLYGTTTSGGARGGGTAFEIDLVAETLRTLCLFPKGAVDQQPGPLLAVGQLLYGSTAGEGASNAGTLFSLHPVTGKLTTLYTFSGVYSGQNSNSSLTAAGDMLFGTSAQAGPAHLGTLYGLDPATGAFNVLHDFMGGADGSMPETGLAAWGNTVYGTTQFGGAAGFGTIFSYDIAANTKVDLHDFAGGVDGSSPAGVLRIGTFLVGATGYRAPGAAVRCSACR